MYMVMHTCTWYTHSVQAPSPLLLVGRVNLQPFLLGNLRGPQFSEGVAGKERADLFEWRVQCLYKNKLKP